MGCWGRAGLALLAQPQACDSSASGKHHKEQWREQGAWLLGGSGPRLFRKAKELGPCSPLPPPASTTAVCFGPGTHSSQGAQLSGKVSPGTTDLGASGQVECPGARREVRRHRPAQLPLSGQDSCITVACRASVSPQEAQVPPCLGWLLTMYWHGSDQLGALAHIAHRGLLVLCRPVGAKRPAVEWGRDGYSYWVHLPCLPPALPLMPSAHMHGAPTIYEAPEQSS